MVPDETAAAAAERILGLELISCGTPYQFQDHAWFVAFAPFEKPEISVSVIVEHGGHGGSAAAPLARKIIKTYFDLYPLSNVQSARKEELKNAES